MARPTAASQVSRAALGVPAAMAAAAGRGPKQASDSVCLLARLIELGGSLADKQPSWRCAIDARPGQVGPGEAR